VRQPAQHGVPGSSLDTAATAPAVTLEGVIRLEDPARKHRVVLPDELAGDGQPQPVDQAELIEIRTVESRLSHVEVFQMGVLTLPTGKTSTCLTLPSLALT